MTSVKWPRFWTVFWLIYTGWYARGAIYYASDNRWGWMTFCAGMVPISFLFARWYWHRWIDAAAWLRLGQILPDAFAKVQERWP